MTDVDPAYAFVRRAGMAFDEDDVPTWPVPTPTWEAEHAATLARIRQENHADDHV